MSEENPFLFKITFTGSHSNDFARNVATTKFEPKYVIGVDVCTRRSTIDNLDVKLILVSHVLIRHFGNYDSFIASLYRGASASVFTFDKSDRASFDDISYLVEERKKHIPEEIPSAIIGLTTDADVVSTEEAQALADRFGFYYYESTTKNINKNLEICDNLVTGSTKK